MESTIQVYIRIRPGNIEEEFKQVVAEHDSNTIRLIGNETQFEGTFNQIFSTSATQEDIYLFVAPTIDKSEQGISSSIIAYGQTGSGKAFTMFGKNDSPGLVYRSGSHIIRNVGKNSCVTFSMIHFYNEQIFDMLQDPKLSKPLLLRQDKILGIYLVGLTEFIVEDPQDVNELVKKGHFNIMRRETHLSVRNRRSHCICQFSLESNSPNNEGNIKMAEVKLVILGGSERTSKTGIQNGQNLEIATIIRSLSALRNIIFLLSSNTAKYIPYRDSKLTHFLKDSLKGKTAITFIATISPAVYNLDETISTLRFAQQAKKVLTSEIKTEISFADNILIQRLHKEICFLKDCMKIQKDSETHFQKLFILQEDNLWFDKDLEANFDKTYEEYHQMKKRLKNIIGKTTNSLTPETNDLNNYCEKYQTLSFPVASMFNFSSRRATPNPSQKKESKIIEARSSKNKNLADKRSQSLDNTLENNFKENLENEEIALRNKRLKALNQIQHFRKHKTKEDKEKFEKAKTMEEMLIKKLETGEL